MTLKLQAIEQRLITILDFHQKLVFENKDKHAMDRASRLIRRLMRLYEHGVAHL